MLYCIDGHAIVAAAATTSQQWYLDSNDDPDISHPFSLASTDTATNEAAAPAAPAAQGDARAHVRVRGCGGRGWRRRQGRAGVCGLYGRRLIILIQVHIHVLVLVHAEIHRFFHAHLHLLLPLPAATDLTIAVMEIVPAWNWWYRGTSANAQTRPSQNRMDGACSSRVCKTLWIDSHTNFLIFTRLSSESVKLYCPSSSTTSSPSP